MEEFYKVAVVVAFILLYSVIKGIGSSVKKKKEEVEARLHKGLHTNASASKPAPPTVPSPTWASARPSAPAFDADSDAVAHLLDVPAEKTAAPEVPRKLPGARISARDAVIWGELLRRKF